VLETKWEIIMKTLQLASSTLNIYKKINKLKKSYIFKHLSEPKLATLSKLMIKEKFNKDDIIVQEGTEGNKFYLIKKGRVK
jgi:CRP-like cAMP-binding protein